MDKKKHHLGENNVFMGLLAVLTMIFKLYMQNSVAFQLFLAFYFSLCKKYTFK